MAKRSEAVSDNLSALHKELEAIASLGYNQYKVFTDWLGLMFHAYMRDDPAYLKIMREYRNEAPEGQREADHFAMAHAYLLEHMKLTDKEVLSGLYMEYAPNTNIGQFFTPYHVADVMCKITCNAYPQDRQFTIYDPTCGAGVFFIAAAKNMTFEENGRVIFIGHDLDINCCRMCALNLMFFNLNGIVIHGNTITMEVRDAWQTRHNALLGGSLRHADPEEVKKWYLAAWQESKEAEKICNPKTGKTTKHVQCSLF